VEAPPLPLPHLHLFSGVVLLELGQLMGRIGSGEHLRVVGRSFQAEFELRSNPLYPWLGYRFFWGTISATHTHTLEKPAAIPVWIAVPVPFPSFVHLFFDSHSQLMTIATHNGPTNRPTPNNAARADIYKIQVVLVHSAGSIKRVNV
jgi:hypothetical protein